MLEDMGLLSTLENESLEATLDESGLAFGGGLDGVLNALGGGGDGDEDNGEDNEGWTSKDINGGV